MPDAIRPFQVELQFPVRTYDIDFAAHVSNIVYIRWLEDLRLAVLENHYPLEHALREGLAPVLVRTAIEYKRAITIFDKPLGRMWVSGMTRVRGVFSAEFVVEGNVMAVAEQIGCFINLSNGRPVPIPKELHDKYFHHREHEQ